MVAVDKIGAGAGNVVIINSDGKAAPRIDRRQKSPVRWFVIGIVDE